MGGRVTPYLASLLLLTMGAVTCQAATVTLVTPDGNNNQLRRQVDLASRFYGLDVRSVSPSQAAVEAANKPAAIALIIDAAALPELRRDETLAAFVGLPMLIVASGAHGHTGALASWSGGQISGCSGLGGAPADDWQLRVAEDTRIARELTNIVLPFRGSVGCKLDLANHFAGRILIHASRKGDDSPVFVDFDFHGHQLFAATTLVGESEETGNGAPAAFTEMASVMMFLRHAAGERAWHMPGSYANLTIDDPWLARRYGNLSYAHLLQESVKHNFHLTIAMIPWNFDRSDNDVVQLFRQNPDRLSISIHGNNHDGQEFGDYSQCPFSRQSASIGQAAARMEEFSRRTSVPFDRVMIFPHSIAPENTIHTLKAANYWATINSENVPLHSKAPNDKLFDFRTATLAFDNVLAVKRYSIEAPVSTPRVAVSMFLGNPILFYGHQQFFATGNGAFNELADTVNRREPATEWRSLGYIVRHFYLLRRVEDQVSEVWAFSPAFVLTNPADGRAVFRVRRAENGSVPIRSVRVDGKEVRYAVANGELRFEATVEARQTSEVEIVYGDGWNSAGANTSKEGIVIEWMRRLSDLRDMRLSTTSAGRSMIAVYYRSPSRMLAALVAMCLLATTGLLLVGRRLLGRRVRLSS